MPRAPAKPTPAWAEGEGRDRGKPPPCVEEVEASLLALLFARDEKGGVRCCCCFCLAPEAEAEAEAEAGAERDGAGE